MMNRDCSPEIVRGNQGEKETCETQDQGDDEEEKNRVIQEGFTLIILCK
jgi:hypothetical protein